MPRSKQTYPVDQFMAGWAWNRENFWRKITQGAEDDCWLWTGSTGPQGPLFGAKKIKQDGRYYPQMTQARRILWAEYHGEYLQPNQNIHHACGNKHCMNPHHLTENKVVRPREQRKHVGRKLGSRVVDGRVIPPAPETYASLMQLAHQLDIGAN